MNNKKGQIELFTNPVILIALGTISIVLFAIFFGFAIFLAFNIFTLLGAFLVIIGAIMAFKGAVTNLTWLMMISGIILILLPRLMDGLNSFTLAAVLA